MTIEQTYSLTEVAARVLPPDWTDAVRWLQRRLRRGEISGYKVGHDWRMTASDVQDLINRHRNAARPMNPVEAVVEVRPSSAVIEGLSRRSRRGLRQVANG